MLRRVLLLVLAKYAAAASTLQPVNETALPQPAQDFEHSSSAVAVYELAPGSVWTISRKITVDASQGPYMAILLNNSGSGVVSAQQMRGNCSEPLPAYTVGVDTYFGSDKLIGGLLDCFGLSACCLRVQANETVVATVQVYTARQPTASVGVIVGSVLGAVGGFFCLLYFTASCRHRRMLSPKQYCGVLVTACSASNKCVPSCYEDQSCELLSRCPLCGPIVAVVLLLTFIVKLFTCVCFAFCAPPPSESGPAAFEPAVATHSMSGSGKDVSTIDDVSPPPNPLASLQSARAERVKHLKALDEQL